LNWLFDIKLVDISYCSLWGMDGLNNQGKSVKLDFYKAIVFDHTLNGCCLLVESDLNGTGVQGHRKSKLLIHPKE